MKLWQAALAEMPLIAILRGVEPEQAIDTADVLVDCGFRIIEVPLNSPDPIKSIERIAARHGDRVIVGAGTVLTADDVASVVGAGGRIIVAPDMNPEVGRSTVAQGAVWCPGVVTPTEAFGALRLGASMLKLFPAESITPKSVAALRAVLPKETQLAAVGGIAPETMGCYYLAGVTGFGLGSALFKPTYERDDLKRRATAFVKTYTGLKNQ